MFLMLVTFTHIEICLSLHVSSSQWTQNDLEAEIEETLDQKTEQQKSFPLLCHETFHHLVDS